MREFEYQLLNVPDDEIRLVRIQPGAAGDELHCSIVHEPLTQRLSYRALSYAWYDAYVSSDGDMQRTEKLIVNNDSSLRVKENLASFFRHIRLTNRETESFWIDAICINQKDTKERSVQILRMREIYKLARDVVVWLGPEKDDSSAALLFIKNTMNIRDHDGEAGSSSGFFWWGLNGMAKLKEDIQTSASSDQWKAVSNLFMRSWWSRTWVAQEAFLARDVVFMCGHETLGWVSLWTLLENLWVHSHWTRQIIPGGANLLEHCSPGRTILWLRQRKEGLDLLKALYHLRPSIVSEPRDKVYRVLGLATDAALIVPSPNYSLSLEEVSLDLLKNMTSVRGDLDWLLLAGDLGTESSHLPSWYPNLLKKPLAVSMNTSRSMSDGKTHGFRAAKGTLPVAEFTSAPSLACTVSGIMVDAIDGLGSRQSLKEPESDIIQPRFNRKAYNTDTDTFTAIWTTLIADQDFEGTNESWRAPASFGRVFVRQAIAADHASELSPGQGDATLPLSSLGSWYLGNRNVKVANKTIREWTHLMAQAAEANDADSSLYPGFERRLRSTIGGRRVVTTEGGYFGVVDDSVRQGDLVCVLLGGRMPVVLRRVEKGYKFVGECYVHGLMFGEAIEMLQSGELKEEQFTLA